MNTLDSNNLSEKMNNIDYYIQLVVAALGSLATFLYYFFVYIGKK